MPSAVNVRAKPKFRAKRSRTKSHVTIRNVGKVGQRCATTVISSVVAVISVNHGYNKCPSRPDIIL